MSQEAGSTDLGTLPLEWHDEQLERVRAVFESVDASVADETIRARVLAELPPRDRDFVTGVGVFRDLLRVEHRTDRFRRLLRIWSGKIAAAVREHQYEAAGLWFRALVEAPVFAEEFAHIVAEARRDLSRPELLEELVVGIVENGSPPAAGPLLASWGEPLVEYLVSQVVTSEPIVNRRHIVDLMGMAGRGDVRHLTARLADPRWFVVRNVAIAIGKAGRASAIGALESVWNHSDDRVRIEVLRAIAALRADEATPMVLQALSDPSPGVRKAAASILRANPGSEVVDGIVAVLEQGVASAEDARRLVEIVAERRDDGVRDALARLASRKFALGASKATREAAKQALERWSADE
jgi:hypothetical protein